MVGVGAIEEARRVARDAPGEPRRLVERRQRLRGVEVEVRRSASGVAAEMDGDRLHQRRFAGAVGPDEDHHGRVEIELVDLRDRGQIVGVSRAVLDPVSFHPQRDQHLGAPPVTRRFRKLGWMANGWEGACADGIEQGSFGAESTTFTARRSPSCCANASARLPHPAPPQDQLQPRPSLVERMEKEGVTGPANHAGKRDIPAGRADRDDEAVA